MTYGAGGTYLIDFAPDTLFVDEIFGNTSNAKSGPFYNAQAAHDGAVAGGRLVFLFGGTYPEPIVYTKTLEVVSIGLDLSIAP